MTMSVKTFGTLKRVMQLATSDSDHEALAALRKANQLLREAGVDWQRVFERCVRVGVEVEEAPDDEAPRSADRRQAAIREAFEEVEASDPRGGFADFVASLKSQFERTGRLTANQEEALFRSVKKAGRR